MIEEGHALPDAQVGILENDEIRTLSVHDLVTDARCLFVGVPAAFLPVCSTDHLPSVARNIPKLRSAGITRFFVMVPDNPWVVEDWRDRLPIKDQFEWLSDGNHDFARRCGLLSKGEPYFMGECTKRYVMQTNDVILERLTVEKSVLSVERTRGSAQVELAKQ